ncbi:MAG: PAS domain S-box protein [gamma proteobacterium symbiont of Bathyaustriella thionipta]|nr:PAS domain S-box protein [gamma proteobacterium symbiont of Bathyaustriella thionipta]MCU7950030.1 PAS domain S-box protein [gamma proteobacterium symbiont of Bathyaustriella thionipta]MCU7952533.1 PAS domain S-box protein [gamma proteobacterium symbiont of Bathyaustriella thionipta]MCU7957784.1 PAS domain S-box protein [gamma proteobacterium symbiont of Bathyaustriella thionipta]MCU7968299.1 PAS domain S-box protein [gamma proteobacterium symbiont of Bathyaustriella thionipta]
MSQLGLHPYKTAMMFITLFLVLVIIFSFKRQNTILNTLNEIVNDLDFQQFALNQHSIVSETDVFGNITYVNDKFCQISGHSREKLLHTNHRITKSNEHSEHFFQVLWDTISNGQVWHGEIKNRAKDGSFYWVNATIVPFLDKHNKPFKYVSIRTDITQQKENESLISEKNKFLHLLTNTMGEGVYALDKKGICIFINLQAEKLLGYSANEILGKNIHNLIHFQDEQGNLIPVEQCESLNSVQRNQSYINEKQFFTRKGGSIFPVRVHSDPLFNQQDFSGSVTVFQDISIRKKTEEALKKAKQQAEEHSQQKSDFLANMSHELRTPMNAIIGLCYLTLETPLDELQRNYLEKIQSSSNVLLDLINDVLDLSKIEAGKITIENIDFKFEDIINQLFHITHSKAVEKGLSLYYYLSPAIPKILIGDSLRITQVMTNLIYNAIKFTESGQIVISITLDETDNTSDNYVNYCTDKQLKIEIQDTGIGLTQEQQNKLFTAFTQADTSTTREYGGTGLGLSISKQLVNLMKGKIGVKSTFETGSTFYFTLPLIHSNSNSDTPTITNNRDDSIINEFIIVDSSETHNNLTQKMLSELSLKYHSFKKIIDYDYLSKFLSANDNTIKHTLTCIINAHTLIDNPILLNQLEELNNKKHHCTTLILNAYDVSRSPIPELPIKPSSILHEPLLPSFLINAIKESLTPSEHIKDADKTQRPKQNKADFNHVPVLLVEDNKVNQLVAKALLKRLNLNVTVANNGLEAVELFETRMKLTHTS